MTDEHNDAWHSGLPLEDPQVGRRVYDQFFDRLVAAARRELGVGNRRDADEEDIAASVLASFFRGIGEGKIIGRVSSRELWALLLTITRRKVAQKRRRRFTLKRGGGRVRGETDGASPDELVELAQHAASEAGPATTAAVRETLWQLIDGLDDALAGRVLLLRLEGHTHSEIAEQLGCATRTVERKIKKVQERWLLSNRAV